MLFLFDLVVQGQTEKLKGISQTILKLVPFLLFKLAQIFQNNLNHLHTLLYVSDLINFI